MDTHVGVIISTPGVMAYDTSRPGMEVPWSEIILKMKQYLRVAPIIIERRDRCEASCARGTVVRIIRKNAWLYFESPDFEIELINMSRRPLPILFLNGCTFFKSTDCHYTLYPLWLQ
jgi:hypothetical protein